VPAPRDRLAPETRLRIVIGSGAAAFGVPWGRQAKVQGGARPTPRRVNVDGAAAVEPAQGTGIGEVEEAVRSAVQAGGGRLPYADFLRLCLYHPARGYYAGFGPGTEEGARSPASDYFTSADLHPAFGHLLAREAALHLERLLREGHERVWVVEVGGGRGLLARDVLQALSLEFPKVFERLRYLLVEPHAGWARVQRANLLPEFSGAVSWVRAAGPGLPLRAVRGVILSNELFDAQPFHVLEGHGAGVREVFITVGEGGGLAETPGPPSRADLARRLEAEGVRLAEAQRGEVSLDAGALALDMARALLKGAVLAADYGDEAQALYDARRRPEGTMRCFFRHRLNTEPLARLGAQDITAHVDFTALARAFEEGGLAVRPVERQADFLRRHGLGEILGKLEREQTRLEREVYVRHRRALEALQDPRGLGANLILTAVK